MDSTKMDIVCDKCGPLDMVEFDGYSIGERILEGVTFEVKWGPGGKLFPNVAKKDEGYFQQLNKAKWLKEVGSFAKSTDIATCPKCKADVDWSIPLVRGGKKSSLKSEPKQFKLIDPMDIFGKRVLVKG